jgi:hypothetical protein
VRGFWAWWRSQIRASGQGTAFVTISAAWGTASPSPAPDYLFVLYPGTERHKRLYFPEWAERYLRPVFPTGFIRFGGSWGMMVGGLATAESLEASPDLMRSMIAETRRQFPSVEVIAMAGRLPGVAEKIGVPLEAPFIHGDRGTVCAMRGAAHEMATQLDRPCSELTIALVGSGGFIGSRLVASLSGDFGRVIALDPRNERRHEIGNVLHTGDPHDVAEAETVLILTARGADTATMAPHLRAGAVVADDTHPEIPAPLRRAMEARGATVLKASIADSRIRIFPRIPVFRKDDIPGCLLEALVVVERGPEVLSSQVGFDAAAAELGFHARLAPHLGRSGGTATGASPELTPPLAAPAPAI